MRCDAIAYINFCVSMHGLAFYGGNYSRGTAYLEFQKAQARTEAEEVGTAIINALDISGLEERAEELRKVEVSNSEAKAIGYVAEPKRFLLRIMLLAQA